MDRPDKLQIARDVIRENIDLLAVMFIDDESDIHHKIQEEIEDIIKDEEERAKVEAQDLPPTKNELGLK